MGGSGRRLKVLIAGAGIAGLTTAIALRHLPDIEVELYERSHELKELGASIALSPNGLRTLERLGVHNALTDDIAFRGPAGLPMIYRHWQTNEIVSVDHFHDVRDPRHHTARFHRAHLHSALLQHVPRELIHLGKKVTSVRVNSHNDKVSLLFSDGTTATGDLLVGADGINSNVRKAFIPGFRLRYTNRTALRAVFDGERVRDIPDLPADSTHWWGIDRNFFASRLGRNQFTVVGMYDPRNLATEHKDSSNSINTWNDEGSVESFRELFKDWNPVVKALTEVTPAVRRFPNYAGEHMRTWVFGGGRVTLVGDAAHAHGGAGATGGSLAIDDAYSLFLALRHTMRRAQSTKGEVPGLSREEIGRALSLYEETRRPHTDKLLYSVLGALEKDVQPPRDDEELRERMRERGSGVWLSEHDVVGAFEGVVAATEGMDREKTGKGLIESRL